MSPVNEIMTLLHSDISSAAIDQLVTKPGLWIRNSLLHIFGGFSGYFIWHHWPGSQLALRVFLWAYLGLQVVQLWSPGFWGALFLDGIWDVLSLYSGVLFAWFLAMRDIPEQVREGRS